jgi:excisionase family DNA binding protein
MSRTHTPPPILTLEDAARYLRVPKQTIKRQAEQGILPGRQIGKSWRFLRAALDDWLRAGDSRKAFLDQFGMFKDDPTLPALRKAIYQRRGRPETENGTDT